LVVELGVERTRLYFTTFMIHFLFKKIGRIRYNKEEKKKTFRVIDLLKKYKPPRRRGV